MLSNKVKNALNEQIQKEAFASNAYLTLATWCEEKNLDGIAEYFYNASNDEREHMLEIYKYLNTYGGGAHIKPMKDTSVKLKNLLDVFQYVFDLEHEVTVAINKLAKLTYEENDFATFKFLEAKNTDGIVKQIIKACEATRPKLRYTSPWIQGFGVRMARIFGV